MRYIGYPPRRRLTCHNYDLFTMATNSWTAIRRRRLLQRQGNAYPTASMGTSFSPTREAPVSDGRRKAWRNNVELESATKHFGAHHPLAGGRYKEEHRHGSGADI